MAAASAHLFLCARERHAHASLIDHRILVHFMQKDMKKSKYHLDPNDKRKIQPGMLLADGEEDPDNAGDYAEINDD